MLLQLFFCCDTVVQTFLKKAIRFLSFITSWINPSSTDIEGYKNTWTWNCFQIKSKSRSFQFRKCCCIKISESELKETGIFLKNLFIQRRIFGRLKNSIYEKIKVWSKKNDSNSKICFYWKIHNFHPIIMKLGQN